MKRRTKSFISLVSILLIILSTLTPTIAASVTPVDTWSNDPSTTELTDTYDITCDLVLAKYNYGDPDKLIGENGGIFKDGDFEVNITFIDEKEEDNEFLSVSFSDATKPVHFVFVKYGSMGDLYYYPDGVIADSNLHVSTNNAISHVTFYYCKGTQQEYGSLEVMKSVVHSDPEGTLPTGIPSFDIMVTGPKNYSHTLHLSNGESELLTGLLPGKYYISETTPTVPYSFVSINGTPVMTDVEVVVAANQKATAAVVNRYTPDPEPGFGALHICKWVITDEGVKLPKDIPDFEVLVTGPNGYEETVHLSHNEAVTLNNLEPGNYLVSETQPTGEYSFETINLTATMTNYEVVVVENGTEEAAIVNKYTPCPDPDPEFGSLLVCKWVITDEDVMLPTTGPNFEILITGPDGYSQTVYLAHGEHETLINLEPGTYKVSEVNLPDGYEFVSINDTEDMTEVEVDVEKNKEAEAKVVNKYIYTPDDPTGSIEIMKFRDRNRDGLKNGSDSWLNNIQFRLEAAPEVDTNMSVMLAPQSWTMTTGSGDFEDGQILFSGLPYGRYKLVELSPRTITAPEELKDGDMYVWVGEEQENVLIEVGNYWNTTTRPDPDPDPDPDPEIIETVTPDPVPLAPTVIEDVTEVVPDETPLAAALPQTGELPPVGAYALGSLLVLAGVFMRQKFI